MDTAKDNKIAELTAEIDRLGLVLAKRQAKIGKLMGEAARAGIAGAPASVSQEERACRAEDALAYLVDQIRKTSPVDDHGHALKMNSSFIKAAELLSNIDTTPLTGAVPPASVPQLAVPVDQDALMRTISNIAGKFQAMKPEDGETWESWYAAAFDLMPGEVHLAIAAALGPVAQPAAPAAPLPEQTGPSEAMERIFESWDGCLYDGMDIGAALREDFKRCVFAAASPPPAPAQSGAKDAAITLWNSTGEQLQSADDTLRALSSYVGQGGCWDTENLDYEEMAARIKEGIDVLVKVSGAAPAQQQEPRHIEITINGRQLRDALEAAWTERSDPDEGDTELTLFVREKDGISVEGEAMERGLWFYWTDYPEEGVCYLDPNEPETASVSESVDTAAPGASIGDKQ